MSWYAIFYLIAMIDNMSTAMLVFWIVAGVLSTLSFFIWTGSEPGTREGDFWITRSIRIMKIFIPVFIVFITFYLFTPDRNSLMLIVAGGVVGEYLAADTNAREVPSEIFELLRAEINKEIKLIDKEIIEDELSGMTPQQIRQELIEFKSKKE